MKTNNYEIFYTTADIGLKIKGKSLNQLFKNAAEGFSSMLGKIKDVNSKNTEEKKINLCSESLEGLIVKFLNEILYIFEVKNKILVKCKVQELNNNCIKGKIEFAEFSNSEIEYNHPVKAVTYHNLKIKKTNGFYSAKIVMDI